MFAELQTRETTGKFKSRCLRFKLYNHADCLDTSVENSHVHGFHVLRMGHIDTHVKKLFCDPSKTHVVVKYGKIILPLLNLTQWDTFVTAENANTSIDYFSSTLEQGIYQKASLRVKKTSSDFYESKGSCTPLNMFYFVLYKWRAHISNITVSPIAQFSVGHMRRIMPTLLYALIDGQVSLTWDTCVWNIPPLKPSAVIAKFKEVYLVYFKNNVFHAKNNEKVVTCSPETALATLIHVATSLQNNINLFTEKCLILCFQAHWLKKLKTKTKR